MAKTSPARLLVVGGGEHARAVIEAARSRPGQWKLEGVVDARLPARTRDMAGVPALMDEDAVIRRVRTSRTLSVVLGVGVIGVSRKRAQIVRKYGPAVRWATIVHRAAWVSPTASLGSGVVVLPGAVVHSGAVIGDHCTVNSGAIVEHDVTLESFVQVAPGAVIGGGATVGTGAYLGLGCRIRDHVRIGARAMVGMGAVVVGPVNSGVTVVGTPARPRNTEAT
jgi:acetyltransferase EpsM